MLKKLFLSTMMIIPMTAKADYSLDDLRRKCETLEAHEQIKFVEKGIACKGTETKYLECGAPSFDLPNRVEAMGGSDYNKMRIYKTPGFHTLVNTASDVGQCHSYQKVRLSANNIVVNIASCSQLNAQYVADACRNAVQEQCGDAFASATCSNMDTVMRDTAGTCSLDKLERVNYCK